MKRIASTTLVISLLALGGTALAAVTVYNASFSKRGDVRAMDKLSGPKKSCKMNWRKKSTLGVTVKGGRTDCALSTPVQGDGKRPDHLVAAVAKVTRATDRKARAGTYVGLTVRANRKEGYELRVFPKSRRWQLLKSGEVLRDGREKGIKPLGKTNRLQIQAVGSNVVVKANRKQLTDFRDQNAEQVGGTKTGLTFGNRDRGKKAKSKAFFDRVKVQVPNP